MIKYITGDFVELIKSGEFDVVILGCNCFHDMSVGINKKVASAFPSIVKADRETERGEVYKLGNYSYAVDKNLRVTLVNIYCQFEPGAAKFEYAAFGLALRNLVQVIDSDCVIGLATIGSGAAGGTWKIIEKIIKQELDSFDVRIVKLI